VLAKASVPASQCVYVDDKPQMLQSAEDLGMRVIAFSDPERLERELETLGLVF
jgi:beta-phosphoglucomutase-like phosphatase (HAD superfamily)